MKEINIAEFDAFLKKDIFPARKDRILESAKNRDAPQVLLAILSEIPDREYASKVEFNRILNEFIQK